METVRGFLQKIHRMPFFWYHIFIVPMILTYVLMVYVGPEPSRFLATYVFGPLSEGPNGTYWAFFGIYFRFIAYWLVFLLFCLISRKSRPILKVLGKTLKGNTLKMFGLGLLIGGGMNLLCAIAAMLNGDIHISFDSVPLIPILGLFVAVVVQSGAEEMICRGFLYQKLRRGYVLPAVAIVGNALYFSALHMSNTGITVLALATILMSGIKYSLMVYYFDSMWVVIGAHTAWNYMQNIILGLPNSGLVSEYSIFKLEAVSGNNSLVYNAEFGIESTLFALLLQILVSAAVLYWGRKNKKTPTDIWEQQIQEELEQQAARIQQAE